MKYTDPPIVVEETFQTTASSLWNAITDLQQMRQWYFENIDVFEPIVGTRSTFVIVVEDRTYTHLWEVTEVIPGEQITYNSNYQEYAGDAFVTFQVIPEEEKVKLRLIMEVVESFPDGIPEFSRESCIGGWNYFIKERLKAFLKESTHH